MYSHPKPPPWWAEVFVLTRAIFGVLFWPLMALVGILAAIVGLFLLFALHWAFGVTLLAFLTVVVVGFALWERRRSTPL